MSNDARRREIAKRAKARTALPQAFATYWMTRDSAAGGLPYPDVRVWITRPTRYRLEDGSVFWLGQNGMADYHATWTLDECVYWSGTYPDDDRMSVRNGSE